MIKPIPIPQAEQRSEPTPRLGAERASAQAGHLGAAQSPAPIPVRSLYLHIPFCFHKCHYCDFYSIVDTHQRQGAFVEALLRELRSLAPIADRERGLRTIFVGGGTPTLLETDLWRRLLAELRDLFNLDPIDAGRGEFTVECNPETATAELMRALSAGGVNRISVGCQSFNEQHLRTLERHHRPENVQRALTLAAEAGIERRNLDLIFAIPGQTTDQWRDDLNRALSLDPGVEHISCYALTYEANTPMTHRMRRGEFEPISDDREAEMHEITIETLARAGFERYEVSNFARRDPQRDTRSLHNLVYWRNEGWLGAGPSAASHLPVEGGGAHRWKNVPRLGEWMRGVERRGVSPIVDHEPPDRRRALAERIMMGLRLSEGLRADSLLSEARQIGVEVQSALAASVEQQVRRGLIERGGSRWRLTDRGFLHADAVAAELMNAVE